MQKETFESFVSCNKDNFLQTPLCVVFGSFSFVPDFGTVRCKTGNKYSAPSSLGSAGDLVANKNI